MPNIFADIPPLLPEELLETLVQNTHIRIERIVSKGHITPIDEWYDQDENEWVILLKGAARLAFTDQSEVELKEGDFINLPAHLKHRVSWTAQNTETVWLAIFY